ncbi:transcription factor AP-4 [Lingula anatina]|uniref:Transcription factor AP-4 n=1 Tax=Lingula anatina TaxID=7574 RepID=A0A1S3H161_LINAN|nr:transcription factor AP-4 [Lingula anatina]|eukprot:XP_013378879.1 transcription factor AP-4 [Lingula anatina]
MSFQSKSADKRRNFMVYDIQDAEALRDMLRSSSDLSPKAHLEQEKKIRREIANSNERRRMQSINAGFETLKTLLPQTDGEKLSKAAILQQTADILTSLEGEKARLYSQNVQLKRMLQEMTRDDTGGSPPPKRKKRDTESSDEGISMSMDENIDELKKELKDLRSQLDHERQLRRMLEKQICTLENQLYREPIHSYTPTVPPMQEERRATKEDASPFYHHHHQIPEAKHESMEDVEETKSEIVYDNRRLQPQPAPTFSTPSIYTSSMSRRNLETIVEAIRHLEGDRVLLDERNENSKGEESERDFSISMSDQEDLKSELSSSSSPSGRESPSLSSTSSSHGSLSLSSSPSSSNSSFPFREDHYTCTVNAEKYPMVSMGLIQRPFHHAYLQRPGVIVHKSS